MTLLNLLSDQRAAISDGWLGEILGTYPPDAAKFFRKVKNQFANPVGQRLASESAALVDGLIDGAEPASLCRSLDEIIRMRAVQDFTPARAVGFVFLLKDVVRRLVSRERGEPDLLLELMEFETRIDQLALYAFDIFVKYREKTYAMRVDEVKRQVGLLMRRSGMFVDDAELEADRQTESS